MTDMAARIARILLGLGMGMGLGMGLYGAGPLLPHPRPEYRLETPSYRITYKRQLAPPDYRSMLDGQVRSGDGAMVTVGPGVMPGWRVTGPGYIGTIEVKGKRGTGRGQTGGVEPGKTLLGSGPGGCRAFLVDRYTAAGENIQSVVFLPPKDLGNGLPEGMSFWLGTKSWPMFTAVICLRWGLGSGEVGVTQ